MHAQDLIAPDLPPLRVQDDIGRALDWMEEFKVSHLPVVENMRLVGWVTDRELVDRNDPLGTVGSVMERVEIPFVRAGQHIYDVVRLFSERGLTVVPVLDDLGQYLGAVHEHATLRALSQLMGIEEPGSVVVLEMNQNDYSLNLIARIVEGEDARLLSVYSHNLADSMRMEVTLKINREDISAVLRSFERYDIFVRTTYQTSKLHEDLRGRYEELMRYINL